MLQMNLLFDTSQFINDIEKMRINNRVDYIDAVVSWCEKNKIEVEYVAAIIKKDPVLKSKLQIEAEDMNIIKKSAKLPI